jgi:hypothetical protein
MNMLPILPNLPRFDKDSDDHLSTRNNDMNYSVNTFVRQAVDVRDEQFLTPAHYEMLTIERDPEALLDRLLAVKHTSILKPIYDG